MVIYRVSGITYDKYHIPPNDPLSYVSEAISFLTHAGYQRFLITFGIVLAINYLFHYISINAIIYFLEDRQIKRNKVFWRYFSTLWLSGIFAVADIGMVVYYALRMDVDSMFLWVAVGIVILVIAIFQALTPFAQYIILLEDLGSESPEKRVTAAINRSISLVGGNIGTTIKFTFLQFFLELRIFLNLAIAIGVPAGVWYLLYESNILPRNTMLTVMGILAIILLLLVMYVDAFINAFFITFWYKLYKFLMGKEIT